MQLTRIGIRDRAAWARAGVGLPSFDFEAVAKRTVASPRWVHFGAGNIFRSFPAACLQALLDMGQAETGVIAVETFDSEIVDRIYLPHDNLTLNVAVAADGAPELSVLSSITEALVGDPSRASDWRRLVEIFESPTLQMASFTITEKGYATRGTDGKFLDSVSADLREGPQAPRHVMSKLTALMLARYKAGADPLALVSMDNCSHNGEKLRDNVVALTRAWLAAGFVDPCFASYMEDGTRVSFPWSMIDKITPRPSESVLESLGKAGVEDMDIIVTSKKTWIAPFVNAEVPQYLFIEDDFPNGRPRLELARGVGFTDRTTVNRIETMKVTTCLNPLHTAISVTGRLLGCEKVFEAVRDPTIAALVRRIGYVEGLPVAVDPGVLKPLDFLNEVVEKRLANPYIPDTTSRIASDTSLKVGIRYGETIKAYVRDPSLDVKKLVGISLAIAAWLRYLLAIDDEGRPLEVSPDPHKDELQRILAGCELGGTSANLGSILSNASIFGSDLVAIGMGSRIQEMFDKMVSGKGAVRATLDEYLKDP
jgi:fructuronate reductase